MDRFKEIESFVAVVSRGSLSAAAQHLGVAPAMISRRLDALESRLGVKLLTRTTRRVTLTFRAVRSWKIVIGSFTSCVMPRPAYLREA